MVLSRIDSDFQKYLFQQRLEPGERLPSLRELSDELGVGIGKLREQMEVARALGLVEASPRRGITYSSYDFLPAVRHSLWAALAIDRCQFEAFSSLRYHLETAYWEEAVVLLLPADTSHLRRMVTLAWAKLNQPRIQIPFQEHRELHLTIYRRLENPFVLGLLEAYWDAYEAVELNTYAEYTYLQQVWTYHDQIVDAIETGDVALGKARLIEHMQLLDQRGISKEAPAPIPASGAFEQ